MWKPHRPRVHASGNFFNDMTRFFRYLFSRKGKKNGRLAKFARWMSKELRRE